MTMIYRAVIEGVKHVLQLSMLDRPVLFWVNLPVGNNSIQPLSNKVIMGVGNTAADDLRLELPPL